MPPLSLVVLASVLLITSSSIRADDKIGPNAWKRGRGRNPDASIPAAADREGLQRRARKRIDSEAPGAPQFRDSSAVDSKSKSGHNMKVKPIALVLPEFHAVPEYERHCNNATEWSLLKRTPRQMGGVTTRFPHSDIGFYNFLEFDHRQYMRVMADHFGIYGFCFIHYWYNGRALLHKAMDRVLEDDEPDKPFFVVWANEPLTKAKDGSNVDVVLEQHYEDDRDNAAHFKYLLKLFTHKNYMTYNDKPILAINRAEPQEFWKIYAIIEQWQEIAAENGMPEIFVIRVMGDHNNDMGSNVFSGVIESEPGLFQVPARPKGSLLTGFQYDKASTWRAIEDRKFRPRFSKDGMHNMFGTYWHYNDAPRRLNADRSYSVLPKIHSPDTLSGFAHHLQKLYWKVANTHVNKVLGHTVLLTSWNVWGEQTMFEPNDVDGYDALSIVKKVFLSPLVASNPRGTILHVARPEDSTRHVGGLQQIFSEYTHVFQSIRDVIDGDKKYSMVHVHHPGLEVTPENMRLCKQKGVPIYISIYDFLWLHPATEDFPSSQFLATAVPRPGDLSRTVTAFTLADVVIFPSAFVRQHYMKFPGLSELSHDEDKFVVAPPPDFLLNSDIISIPDVSNMLGVGLVGEFTPVMGAGQFSELSMTFDHVESGDQRVDLKYHVLSSRKNCNMNDKLSIDVTVCSMGKDGNILKEVVAGPNILHMLLFLSDYPDPYSYEITTSVNSGLPILYLNRDSLKERLSTIKSPRFFPINDMSELRDRFIDMIKYTMKYNGETKGYSKSSRIQPSKWWLSNYPTRRAV